MTYASAELARVGTGVAFAYTAGICGIPYACAEQAQESIRVQLLLLPRDILPLPEG